MLFQIKSRFDGLVKCEVEIACRSNESESSKLGKAVLAAWKQGANLYGANLGSADLRSADLGGECGKVKRLVTSLSRSDGYQFFAWEREEGGCYITAGCQSHSLLGYRKRVAETYYAEHRGLPLIQETTNILDFIEKRYEATK